MGGESEEFVRVVVVGDNSDGWLSARVELAVGRFSGTYSADLTSMAFSRFAAELAVMYDTVSGVAAFTDYERQIELLCKCDVKGHVSVAGEAMDFAGTGNRLTFRLDLDQSHLPRILSDLRVLIQAYPERVV
jgi:hypothetical protein